MSYISVREQYGLYLDTIGRCSSDLLGQSDEELEHNLYEQFDTGAQSFLHEDTLARLRDAGYIDDEMVALSKDVRNRWFALADEYRYRPTEEIRTNTEWKELFALMRPA